MRGRRSRPAPPAPPSMAARPSAPPPTHPASTPKSQSAGHLQSDQAETSRQASLQDKDKDLQRTAKAAKELFKRPHPSEAALKTPAQLDCPISNAYPHPSTPLQQVDPSQANRYKDSLHLGHINCTSKDIVPLQEASIIILIDNHSRRRMWTHNAAPEDTKHNEGEEVVFFYPAGGHMVLLLFTG
ncbi:unnamed protein product [Pleuronectes platessa]|uniref:Uncharacterized protein n=1 Tax=Pleuronectes platessa TaxID=8262 RepID=A0A9N7VIY6_PLEPL|nr:unnamed protein product [Pleuronectes platessa]